MPWTTADSTSGRAGVVRCAIFGNHTAAHGPETDIADARAGVQLVDLGAGGQFGKSVSTHLF